MSNLVEHSGEAKILSMDTPQAMLEKAKQLPNPVGEFILCAIPEVILKVYREIFK